MRFNFPTFFPLLVGFQSGFSTLGVKREKKKKKEKKAFDLIFSPILRLASILYESLEAIFAHETLWTCYTP